MSDRSLIKKCQCGNKQAFEDLLNLHYDTIYRFAYRWCHDQHNAQDITQQVCIKLAKSIHQFSFKSSFTSWLYTLVINTAKDFYKSPNQFNYREQSIDQTLDSQITHKQDDNNLQRLYAQQILEHINTLDNTLKDTLVLVYGQGLSHKSAADLLNVKESTVSWRIHEVRKQLKDTFESPSPSNTKQSPYSTNSTNSTRGSV